MAIYLIIIYFNRNRNPIIYIYHIYKIYRFLCITATVNLYCNLYNAKKMADFKMPGLGIGVEFERNDIYEGNNFSEGPIDPKRDAKVIRVQFDIVFSLSNKGKVSFRNVYFWYCPEKVVRLKPYQPDRWLRPCNISAPILLVFCSILDITLA